MRKGIGWAEDEGGRGREILGGVKVESTTKSGLSDYKATASGNLPQLEIYIPSLAHPRRAVVLAYGRFLMLDYPYSLKVLQTNKDVVVLVNNIQDSQR